MNREKKIKINKNNKKTQKGIIPYKRRSGNILKEGVIGIIVKKSIILKEKEWKGIKSIIINKIPKNIEKRFNITPIIPVSKRQGARMGKGKGKINSISYRIPKSFILVEIDIKNLKKIDTKTTYNILLKRYKILNNIIYNMKKIIMKYPKLELKRNK